MGGRAAENIFLGDMTNGANGDLDSAKNIARKMIHDWGMGKKLYYEPTRDDAEREINSLLADAMNSAHEIIHKFSKETELLAEKLLVEETLTREEVLRLFGRQPAQETAPDCPEPTSDLAVA
jgi:cell division protease FtsH